tara:strand:- start:659 stop:1855 length:1197 start_codon:yes stop_codon:yes gene_type:complete
MAFYLEFDGANDRVSLASGVAMADGISIDIDFEYGGDNGDILSGFISNNPGRWALLITGGGNLAFFSGTSGTTTGTATLVAGTRYTVNLSYSGGVASVSLDENPDITATPSALLPLTQIDNGILTMGLYGLSIGVGGSVIHNYDPSASNGTGSILPDTVGGNDGTLVNFPTDDSQWVFYDDGGGGVLDISPSSILPEELFGTPSITPLGISILPPSVDTEEVLGALSVSSAGVSVQPMSVSSSESVGDAGVSPLGVNIFPITIPSQEAVQEPIVAVGLTVLNPDSVESEEVVPEPLLDLMLKQVLVPSVPDTFSVGKPNVVGGDRIVIPIIARTNFTRIQEHLKSLGFSGALEDTILAWLRSEGYEGQWNDAWYGYLEDLGHTGALPERLYKWKREVT